MASNILDIKAEILRLLGTVTLIALVEDEPASAEEWLSGFKDAEGSMTPAVHVSYGKEQAIKTAYTCGDFHDTTSFRLTCVYASAEFNADEAVTLRDAILDTVCSEANQTLSGLADTVDAVGWGFSEQDGTAYTTFTLDLSVAHTWARA